MMMRFTPHVDMCFHLGWCCFLEVLQAGHLNEVNNGSRALTALDTASVEAEWLRELLIDLPVVEKSIPAISMNCNN